MPDYEGYVKSLEKIPEGVSKDYWSSFIDIKRHQHNVGRVHLWISAALFGVYLAVFDKLFFGEISLDGYFPGISVESIVLSIVLLSSILAILAFGISLYAMPARRGYQPIQKKDGENSRMQLIDY
uniref:Uncharacterized protein n=1 Tax=Candidatus Kentrum sp. MB TaxID=2138164 RepID=A0A451BEP0_9GAMM|nr:MAG: hypothetical protein BECKMB1821I_GA0114274_106115 [Candidatus Kentron sp. MB]VFK76750.1 MAG: hypothetical protein BECKMB1821H_GA0114242_107215 [Candidatus Kentron sp. MB]